jgi:hypothetical protein
MQGGVGLFVTIFFCQNTGAKKGFPLQSLTQTISVTAAVSTCNLMYQPNNEKDILFNTNDAGFLQYFCSKKCCG